MRHKESGWRLGRNTAHRRSLLRNLVTSLILEERIETTVIKAKAMRPNVEKMITLGKRGGLSARRQAAAYLMTREAVTKLFDTIAPRFAERPGGYTRLLRIGYRKGDSAEVAQVELIGSEYDPKAKEAENAEEQKPKAKGVGGRLRAAAERLRGGGKKDENEAGGGSKNKATKPAKGTARRATTPRKAGGS
jgi:large subunit ribosomal protein L17